LIKKLFFRNTKITGVVIPNGVISIGNSAFRDCAYITSVIIPNSVTSIENSAFQSCSRLNGVTIGSGVTKIGNYAFADCINLKSVTIGSGVQEIGIMTFNNCVITSVTFQGTFAKPVMFNVNAGFEGDLRDKYLAGGAGTYTLSGKTWTKK